MTLLQTPEEKLEAAEAELATARAIFKARNHALKEFDRDHYGILVLSAEEARERALLKRDQREALAQLREIEEIQKFQYHTLYSMKHHLGRSDEFWRSRK